jgi:hypothetical protein
VPTKEGEVKVDVFRSEGFQKGFIESSAAAFLSCCWSSVLGPKRMWFSRLDMQAHICGTSERKPKKEVLYNGFV